MILSVLKSDGSRVEEQNDIKEEFLAFYQKHLGQKLEKRKRVREAIVRQCVTLNTEHRILLDAEYAEDDIKKWCLKYMGIKPQDPMGLEHIFFQDTWEIIGKLIVEAVKFCLGSGKILKELNNTSITLIPKMLCPNEVGYYRPIACCNVLYKVITKMICLKLKKVLPLIVAPNQSGFIDGRIIAHNIMVFQDIVGLYGRSKVKPSCIIKLDIQKAY